MPTRPTHPPTRSTSGLQESPVDTSDRGPSEPGQAPHLGPAGRRPATQIDANQSDANRTDANRSDANSAETSRLPERLGRYSVRGVLGEGRFGVVYDAFDDQLQRRVAIKVPAIGSSGSGQADVEAFLGEARRLARLSHPGIVSVHDVGVESDAGADGDAGARVGQCYLVSDFVPGPSLRQWLSERRPSWQQAALIALRIAEALAYAHAQRVVHRDVKPANIVLTPELHPVLLDFGLALAERPAAGGRGQVAGTPAYMSPEQARGEAHRIDGRTDIYSLGVVLYEMLCGQRPFVGDDLTEILRQVREDAPQPPRQLVAELPESLERICLRAMSKRVADRFVTAGEMARQLRDVLRQAGALELPLPEASRPLAPAGRGSAPAPVGASDSGEGRIVTCRQVTILACRCRVSPAASLETRHEMLQLFRQLCDEAARELGGYLMPHGGSAAHVCFGYPRAWEDGAQRAVHCGRRLLREIERLAGRVEAPLDTTFAASCGVHTGETLIEASRENPPRDVVLVGDVAAIAERLEADAEPNAVLVSHHTHRLLRDRFRCEPAAPCAWHRDAEPIETLRVLAAADEGTSRLAGAASYDRDEPAADMAAREKPVPGKPARARSPRNKSLPGGAVLELLRERWAQAQEQLGQVVVVVGEPGIGKTRLLNELQRSAEQRGGEPIVMRLRCCAHEARPVLNPVTNMLERLWQFQPDDGPAVKLEKLIGQLERVGLADPRGISLLAALLSIPLDDRFPSLSISVQQQKEQTCRLLLDWLWACAACQPVLLLADDLQWADASTWQWLAGAAEACGDQRLLLVLARRPEPEAGWSVSPSQTQISLPRLTFSQSLVRAQELLGHPPADDPRLSVVARLGDGIPLFIKELCARPEMLPDSDSELIAVPPLLRDLLTAQLDQAVERPELVELAAVIGRSFDLPSLVAASAQDPNVVQQQVERLVAAGLVERASPADHGRYRFRHALTPYVVRQSLPSRQLQQRQESVRLGQLSAPETEV